MWGHSGKPVRNPLHVQDRDWGNESRDKAAAFFPDPLMAGVVFVMRRRAEIWAWAGLGWAVHSTSDHPPSGPLQTSLTDWHVFPY